MGNCCGKQSDNFSTPGRTLGSAPAPQPNPSAPLPKKISSNPVLFLFLSGSECTSDYNWSAAARAAEVRYNRAEARACAEDNANVRTTGQGYTSEWPKRETRAEAARREETDQDGHIRADIGGGAETAGYGRECRGQELELERGVFDEQC